MRPNTLLAAGILLIVSCNKPTEMTSKGHITSERDHQIEERKQQQVIDSRTQDPTLSASYKKNWTPFP